MIRSVMLALACSAGLVPIAAHAASSSQQEYLAAVRATPDLARGAEQFRQCAACHGNSGSGSDDGDVPRIAGQHFQVLIRQLVDYRHNTRWDIRMERVADRHVLTETDTIASVAAYASHLAGEQRRSVGNGELVALGASLYAQRCAKCHGRVGEGDGARLIPRLAGQQYAYLLRQMHDTVDGRRPNFPLEHARLLARLQRDDLVGVADFLARSKWAGPQEPGAAER